MAVLLSSLWDPPDILCKTLVLITSGMLQQRSRLSRPPFWDHFLKRPHFCVKKHVLIRTIWLVTFSQRPPLTSTKDRIFFRTETPQHLLKWAQFTQVEDQLTGYRIFLRSATLKNPKAVEIFLRMAWCLKNRNIKRNTTSFISHFSSVFRCTNLCLRMTAHHYGWGIVTKASKNKFGSKWRQ